MDPKEIASGLAEFEGRAAGSDAERRAAMWLTRRLRRMGRDADLETEWVRPHWPWVHALHAILGVVGALVSLGSPVVGLVVVAVAFVSSALDQLGLFHLLRRLTPERATQNIVSGPTAATRSGAQRMVRLVIVGHYDAPRGGIVRRRGVRRAAAILQRITRGYLPGALGVIPIALLCLVGVAIARMAGMEAQWLDGLQLAPTLALLVAVGALIDVGLSQPGPGAGDPASGAAVAIALAAALDRAPPHHLAVELVLAGAGAGPSLGMCAFVSRRRLRYAPESTAVLHVGACGRGRPSWWTVDGPFVSRRLHPRLATLCEEVSRDRPDLGARAHRGHGAGAAWRARIAGWPAITIGCLDSDDLVPDAGRATDTPDQLDAGSMRAALEFCRRVVERLDGDLGRRRRGPRRR